ncbi:acetylornithine deacetylase [Suttonella sp. R2A3]|uniref:acetylornithine deacetylase n=1 Tax=Suttonella sp. R2A3 TaxID=2908648 RepID=UPI001F21D0E3|nr:acetylornithine deacetylase [Suttonella sp. R2A3]UJF24642.1 acetylornithine deacetylase [Suttonella sp. R2A3]
MKKPVVTDYSVESLLQRLIAHPSVSSEPNRALIDEVAALAASYADDIAILPNETGDKAGLLLRFGHGEGGLVFSGHSDVVPVVGQDWHSDPFDLHKADGRYYGRGVADMKGFIACVLSLMPWLAEQNLARPVIVAISYDEEIGCLGAPQIIEGLQNWGAQGALAVIGEPTLLEPVVAQKGITNLRTTVYGKPAHSSQIGQGISAVHEAAKLIVAIEAMMGQWQQEGRLDGQFAIPFSSLHVGTVHGGEAVNINAASCQFDWELRHLPQDDAQILIDHIAAAGKALIEQQPGLRIEHQRLIETVPALAARDQGTLLDLLSRHLPDMAVQTVAYATEAGIFQQGGFPAVILGPGCIRQAHQADEWVECAQLEQCVHLLRHLINDYCINA